MGNEAETKSGEAKLALERLAAFLRLRAIYPANNQRVRACAGETLSILRARHLHAAVVRVRLTDGDATVDGQAVPMDLPMLRWFAETLRRVSVGGFDILTGVDENALEFLAAELQRCSTGTPQPLAGGWPEHMRTLRPVELMIVGRHVTGSGGPGGSEDTQSDVARHDTSDSELVASLRNDPRIRERLAAVQASIDSQFGVDGTREEIDILNRIVDLARADRAFDERGIGDFVASALQQFDHRVLAALAEEPEAIDAGVSDVALRVARQYFAPRGETKLETATDDLPSGRPEDEAVVDDLPGLIGDYATLPVEARKRCFEDDRVVRNHVVAVLTNLVAAPILDATPLRAAAKIAALAESHPDLDLSPIDRCLQRGDGATASVDHVAVLRAFHDAGKASFLFQRQGVDPETVAAVFPQWFGSWIDSLTPGRSADHQLFHRFLDHVMPHRLEAGLRELVRSHELLRADRLTRMVELARQRAGAILANLCAHHPNEIRPLTFRWLSSADLPPTVATALRILPSNLLPNDHLVALCRLADGDRSILEAAASDAGQLVRRFVVESSENPALADHRLRAIRALANLPSPQTRSILQDLARGWSLGSGEKREIRRAAAETLRAMEGRPCA